MSSEFIFIFAIIIAVIVLWVSVYMLMKRSEEKRTEQFQQAASELGRPFFPKGDGTLLERLDHFYLFSRGFNKRILNLLYGKSDNGELLVFDYQYITGGARSRKAWNQSVIYFRSPTLDLPLFAVRPKGLLQNKQGIDFEIHPQFSKAYLVEGENELEIRQLFGEELRIFFQVHQEISVEGENDQLIIYRHKKRIEPDEIQQFKQEGQQVFTLFQGTAAIY